MLKKRVAALVVSAPLLLAPPLLMAGSGWTKYATVMELTPTGQMRYIVKLDLNGNPSGCKVGNTFYQDYGAIGADKMFRVLLEALNTGKRVRLFVSGTCELNGYAEFSSVSITP